MLQLFAGAEPLEQTRVIPVPDVSHVGEARRAVASLGAQMALDETAAGRVAIVVTELAANIARHGGGGQLLVRAIEERTGVEVVAVDNGPGVADIDRAMRDGFSTGGTPGKGLGAVKRMSDVFDLYTQPGQGMIVLSRMRRLRAGSPWSVPFDYGVVSVAVAGEVVSGDGWIVLEGERGASIVVIDGLGHGQAAHEAARAGVDICVRQPKRSPSDFMTAMHAALRPTRGAAAAVAEFDQKAGELRFVGVGNIAASVMSSASKSLASMNGTVGREPVRIREFTAPVEAGATIVLHSDGIATRWQLDAYAGVRRRHPALLAALLFRDFARGRDDATVFVARGARPSTAEPLT